MIFKLKKLYLARDPIGIKPLFYYQKKQSIFFASEIKGIINFQNNIVPNYNILVDFIKWGALDHSKNSWFKNIKNVEPGTFIEINSAGKFSVSKFWDLKKECESIQIKKENIEDYFLSLLQDSILKQSQTVRSIGTHLSGGVDSSIVTLLLSKLKNNIQTFTFGYKEKKYDERAFAKQVSNHLKIKNFNSLNSAEDVNKNFINVLLSEDEPFTSFRQISHHKLYSDFKTKGSTVILESSGGDEIGAGYPGFIWPFFLDDLKKNGINRATKNLYKNLEYLKLSETQINDFISSGIKNQIHYGTITSDGKEFINSNILDNNFEKKYNNGYPNYEKKFDSHLLNSQFTELRYTKLPRGLRYIDRASSGVGREARIPLLDTNLIKFCFSIPNEAKINSGNLRWFMKLSVLKLSKNKIKIDNKRYIADPQVIWIKKYFNEIFLKLFKSKKFRDRQIFNHKEVINSFNNFLKNKDSHSLGIFQIFITEIWLRLFIDNDKEKFKGIGLREFINETN